MKWMERFLSHAKFVAQYSKDPSTKVGCVIVDDLNRVVSQGFNGLPRGVEDSPHRLMTRELKYEMVVHAEANALLFATVPVRGCTLYCWPLPPCSRCAGLIIQAGIKRVVAPAPDERWKQNCELARTMFMEAGVEFGEWQGRIP